MSEAQESSVNKTMDKLHLGSSDKDTDIAPHSTAAHVVHPGSQPPPGAGAPVSGSVGTSAQDYVGTNASSTPLSGSYDSHDLNRGGHNVFVEEKAFGVTGPTSGVPGTHATRDTGDLNQGGHRLKTAVTGTSATGVQRDEEYARMKLHEEQLAVSKRTVGAGEIGIHKRVEAEHVSQSVPVKREEIYLEHRPITGAPDPQAKIADADEVARIPLYREELVTEKRLVPVEEVIVHKRDLTDYQTVSDTLRSEHIDMSQAGVTHGGSTATGVHDARDTDHDGKLSLGEKIKAAIGLT